MKNDGVGGRVYSPVDVTSYECEVCTRYASALYSPSRLNLETALVRQGFITKYTSVCRLICAAIWRPYSTTNKGEVWALQRHQETCRTASVNPNNKVQ